MLQLFADSWRNYSSEVSLAEKLISLVFIDNYIHKFLNKLFIKPKRGSNTTQKKEITISLEYFGKMSLLAKKQLTNTFRSCRKDIKLKVVFKTSNRLRNAFRFKKPTTQMYQFKCYINISATFAIMSPLAKPNAI